MKSADKCPVTHRVLDAAIEWQLCLGSGAATAQDEAEFSLWFAADPEHARAWRQLGMLDQRFATTSAPARAALTQARDGMRQRLGKWGGAASLLLISLFGAHRYLPIGYWMADQRTATGEQRSVLLDDNTLVRLNTHSAIDVRFDSKRRLIVLEEGEIQVETGSHGDPRPFIVETADGSMRALGTRFLVRREAQGTRLSVLQSAVAARPDGPHDEQKVRAGQQLLIRSDGLGTLSALAPGADAWVRGMLVVDNTRLADLATELGRYRRGYLGVSPEVADLRITGSFPLNDPDLALKALLPTLPIRIEKHGPWWVTLNAAQTNATAKNL